MALTNAERVGKGLELLKIGLAPFLERELRAEFGEAWLMKAKGCFPNEKNHGLGGKSPKWDAYNLLAVMSNLWNVVFNKTLGKAERTLVMELQEVRNAWAHQDTFSTDSAYRALDSMFLLLTAVSASQATELDRQKHELLRIRFEEQARKEKQRSAATAIEGQPSAGLKPWREIITPHPDVASGRYQQAEFAADLGQVHRGEGSDEYRNPTEFYRRTFITVGLKALLSGATMRLAGKGGDPVIELQTNFGGGKTHSLLALYHLFSNTPASDLPGVEEVLEAAGLPQLPVAKRAVLVGTAISPAQPQKKADGTVVNTLWGDMAWQLLGKDGYKMVAEADKAGVSPGSEALRELFNKAYPSLVLIDEWVAYVRQLYGKDGLCGGSFEAALSFAQALTEAARACKDALVVASIPSSDIEIGGEAGKTALDTLKNTFGRMESPWRPAGAEESFEIVRRRLFEPISDPALFKSRDAVVRGFSELYRSQHQEFPPDCREGDYERRMKASYPIHPELFDRLYNDWSTLDKFQRTRGVLRLMAAVIHSLWERQDGSLMILPSSVPVDEGAVQYELTRYMEDPWIPVIEKDVDGPHSLPLQLDRDNPNLGRYSASRRVARSLYIGSAPTLHTANRGLEDRQIRLGCCQPGESVATFGDALRRLTDTAAHLYVDGRRYWYSTQPSVTRLAQDRAAQFDDDAVRQEIVKRLAEEKKTRGEFAGVHPCPASSGDVQDTPDTRLVILDPEHPHASNNGSSPAKVKAHEILTTRGNSPREYSNCLVFLAADKNRLVDLEQAVRQYLAWKSIEDEREPLNLDAFQANQAKTKREQADEAVRQRIPETYQWALVPEQDDPKGTVEWQQVRVQGQEALAVRTSKKLKSDELLMTEISGSRLRLELDRIPLWQGNDVPVKQIAQYFAKYLYLPRLKNQDLVLDAVRDGMNLLSWEHDSFAYSDAWDAAKGRYVGLRAGRQGSVTFDGLLVKPDAAMRQLEEEHKREKEAVVIVDPGEVRLKKKQVGGGDVEVVDKPVVKQQPKRFHGTVRLNVTRLARDAASVNDEVIQHLVSLLMANVDVVLDISATVPEGIPDYVIRIVNENCNSLRFEQFGFEEE